MTSIILRNNEKDRLKGGLFGLSRCYQHHLNHGSKSEEVTYYQRITCRRGQRIQIRVQYSVIERVSQVCASIPAGFYIPISALVTNGSCHWRLFVSKRIGSMLIVAVWV